MAAKGTMLVRALTASKASPYLILSLRSPFHTPKRWCARRPNEAVNMKEFPIQSVCARHQRNWPTICMKKRTFSSDYLLIQVTFAVYVSKRLLICAIHSWNEILRTWSLLRFWVRVEIFKVQVLAWGCLVILMIPVSYMCIFGLSTAATSSKLNVEGYRKKKEMNDVNQTNSCTPGMPCTCHSWIPSYLWSIKYTWEETWRFLQIWIKQEHKGLKILLLMQIY